MVETMARSLYPFHMHGTGYCARCAERLEMGRLAHWWEGQRFCLHCIQVVPDPPVIAMAVCGNPRCVYCKP